MFRGLSHVAIAVPDLQKAKDRLAFVPPVSLQEGLRRTAAWLATVDR